MICILTERRLKAGSWDDFRRAWEPAEPPPVPGRAYHARDVRDPDHVISFGLFDVDLARFQELAQDPRFGEQQRARFEAMAPFVTETGADGIFEVIEVVEEPGSGG
jgi:hypothetical protein